ncbi:MAG: mannose-1-phosphate guanylyltransferase [Spirochaetaceae bacterium]|nr:mannose-1-phosphate guanylyltransferase [Spirochaetaceae bacterium]
MSLITLILAGGSGTRLWPASRAAAPKQYLSFDGGPSYLQQALLRARAVSSDAVMVVTAEDQVDMVAAQTAALDAAPGAAPCYVVGEPAARNTAPAVALGAALAGRIGAGGPGGAALLVLSSDHAIEPEAAFAADVRTARGLARHGWLTTFGIRPTRPETGYGYLELGERLGGGYRVAAFREKPDRASAERFLAAGGFLWNAGMFLFPLTLLASEMRRHAPEVAALLDIKAIRAAPSGADVGGPLVAPPTPELRAAYDGVPAISIDYALMERSDRVAAVPASFRWSDVGSWDELARIADGDEPVAAAEAHGNAVYSDLPVALAGVDDLIVVVKNGAVLVTRKGRTQLVRDAVQDIGKRRPDLL